MRDIGADDARRRNPWIEEHQRRHADRTGANEEKVRARPAPRPWRRSDGDRALIQIAQALRVERRNPVAGMLYHMTQKKPMSKNGFNVEILFLTRSVMSAGESFEERCKWTSLRNSQIQSDASRKRPIWAFAIPMCPRGRGRHRTGIGAFLFRELIGLVHNLFFLQTFSLRLRQQHLHPVQPVGAVGHPGAGRRGDRCHLHHRQFRARGERPRRPRGDGRDLLQCGRIRPIVAVAKSLASALAIGSGAAVGREGPIIQIGSALGSTLRAADPHAGRAAHHPGRRRGRGRDRGDLQHADRRRHVRHRADAARGQRQHLPARRGGDRHRDVYRPAGLRAAAGIQRAGDRRAAACPPALALATLALYTALGALCGVAAALFIRGLHFAEDLFDKVPGQYTRHIFGMLLLGA